jgi:hypothetical protein
LTTAKTVECEDANQTNWRLQIHCRWIAGAATLDVESPGAGDVAMNRDVDAADAQAGF